MSSVERLHRGVSAEKMGRCHREEDKWMKGWDKVEHLVRYSIWRHRAGTIEAVTEF